MKKLNKYYATTAIELRDILNEWIEKRGDRPLAKMVLYTPFDEFGRECLNKRVPRKCIVTIGKNTMDKNDEVYVIELDKDEKD